MADTGKQGQGPSMDTKWGTDEQLPSQTSKSHTSKPTVISLKSVGCM